MSMEQVSDRGYVGAQTALTTQQALLKRCIAAPGSRFFQAGIHQAPLRENAMAYQRAFNGL